MSLGYYPQDTPGTIYVQPRPDWSGYGQHPQYGMLAPTSADPIQHPHQFLQVHSFPYISSVQQQHKRPRRTYDEIDRMYKCGWNGCEKAYGTLNHLNAHVKKRLHGLKRTPEEFREIRKEWKARKSEDDNQRNTKEERARGAANPIDDEDSAPSAGYQLGGTISYQANAHHPPATSSVTQLQQYSGGKMYTDYSLEQYEATVLDFQKLCEFT